MILNERMEIIMNGPFKKKKIDSIVNVVFYFLIFVIISFLFVITARAGEVSLTWDHNNPLPDGYRIYMRIDNNHYDYSTAAWEGKENQCTIDGLSPANQYFFVVRAFIGEKESGNSNEVGYYMEIPAPENLKLDIKISVNFDINGIHYIASDADQ